MRWLRAAPTASGEQRRDGAEGSGDKRENRVDDPIDDGHVRTIPRPAGGYVYRASERRVSGLEAGAGCRAETELCGSGLPDLAIAFAAKPVTDGLGARMLPPASATSL
jgi:hypothetical protein